MGQVLHGSATTTEAVRRSIQRRQESLRALAKRYGINPKTVTKWRNCNSLAGERTGPKDPKSTVLTVEEEAIIVAFRRHTLLPLYDCLYALQATIPNLARVPTRWNHLVEKNSRKFNGLSMIFSQKWFPLLRIML